MTYIEAAEDGVILRIQLQPRSSKNEIAGVIGDCLKVRVNAPPVEGAANEACRSLLAKLFGIAKGSVQIIAGSKSRQKRVFLKGLEKEAVMSRISELVLNPQGRDHSMRARRGRSEIGRS